MGDIADGIFDLALGQGAAAPIGKARALVDGKAQPRLYQIGIADLFGLADRHHRDLGVENRVRGLAGDVEDDLDILPARVEDFQHVLVIHQQVHQWAHIEAFGQRIDGCGFLIVGDLDQAEFRPKGVFAHEFGVNADEIGGGEALAEVGEGFGSGNQRVNYHECSFLLGGTSGCLGLTNC